MTEQEKSTANGRAPMGMAAMLTLLTVLAASVPASSQAPVSLAATSVVARVNGVAIQEAELRDETEILSPSNSVHGSLRVEKLKEIRSKALEELIVQELAYQQAVKARQLVPMPQVLAEYERLRAKYGAKAFAESLGSSGMTREQYMRKLQRRMTLERLARQKLVLPSRMTPQAVRAYYDQNPAKFRRPEQVHPRLITIKVEAGAKSEEIKEAKRKIDTISQQLRAGKDFGALAEDFSEDFYRVKGGDLGWAHQGRLDPEFEKVAFSLQPGQISQPFQTEYGFHLLKVEGREPARQMKFEEVRPVIKAELEQKKYEDLRQAWVASLKSGAQIEIPELQASSRPLMQPAH